MRDARGGLLLSRTTFGRALLAIGGNEEAARLAGVPVRRVKFLAYVASGLFAGIAGGLLAGRTGIVVNTDGDGYELDAIAATVIGGTSLQGARFDGWHAPRRGPSRNRALWFTVDPGPRRNAKDRVGGRDPDPRSPRRPPGRTRPPMTPIVRPLISLVSSLSLVFGSAAFSLGCSNGHSDSGPVIGGSAPNGGKHQRYALIVKTQQNPVFICSATRGRRGGEEARRRADPAVPADEKNFQEQVEYVRIATRKKVDAILIAPADSKLLVAPLKEAQDAGIKIINIDNALDPAEMQSQGLKLDAFVGVDNVEGGRLAADFLAKKIGEAGQVAMLEGFVGVANSEQRKQGFKEAIAKYPKIELVAVATGEWYPAKAMEVTQGLLQKYPN